MKRVIRCRWSVSLSSEFHSFRTRLWALFTRLPVFCFSRRAKFYQIDLTALQIACCATQNINITLLRCIWTVFSVSALVVTWTGAHADVRCRLMLCERCTLRAHVTATVQSVETTVSRVADDDDRKWCIWIRLKILNWEGVVGRDWNIREDNRCR